MELEIQVLLISFIISCIIGLCVIPILKRCKVGQTEREDGPQSHLVKQGTPTMGGIIMILTIIIVSAYVCITTRNTKPEIHQNLIPVLIATIGFGVVGLIDDFKKLVLRNTKGVSPSVKMLLLLIVASFYTIYLVSNANIGTEIYIPFAKIYLHLPVVVYIPFTIIVMLSTTNAINLTDGIDGLATSVTIIIMATLIAIATYLGILSMQIFGCIICGTCVGFWIFNFNKAKIFMGDTGSLLLGGAISSIAIYAKMPLILLIIAIVPIIETLSVLLQVIYFKKTGNRLFKMAPIHHHFELCGWKENKVVAIFSLATFVACMISLIAI